MELNSANLSNCGGGWVQTSVLSDKKTSFFVG